MEPQDVLDYWIGTLDAEGLPSPDTTARWFRGGAAVDEELRERFGADVEAAQRGERESWAETPSGRLALVILLDQFTRNLFRGRAEAFSGDERALAHACAAVDAGEDRTLRPVERYFLYMPFEHAEDRQMQARCCALFAALLAECPAPGRSLFEGGVSWAERHRVVVDRFGRFPSRNEALGRATTPDEAAFLRENPTGF